MSKEISLKDGRKVIVDDDIYEKYDGFKNFYLWITDKGYITIASSLHRLVMVETGEIQHNKHIDHIDQNPLNNCKENLRWVTRQQNRKNSKKHKITASSSYKGVSWKDDLKKWGARIRLYGKSIHIGFFDNELDAAIAYDIFAKKENAEYVSLNFPNATSKDINRVLAIIENPKKRKGCYSIYRGVYQIKGCKKCNAKITYKSKRYYLGSFDTQEEAALAYNVKAIELYGDKAKLNRIS